MKGERGKGEGEIYERKVKGGWFRVNVYERRCEGEGARAKPGKASRLAATPLQPRDKFENKSIFRPKMGLSLFSLLFSFFYFHFFPLFPSGCSFRDDQSGADPPDRATLLLGFSFLFF